MPASRQFINASVYYSGTNEPAPVLTPSASRVNVTTAAGASSAEVALPAASKALRIGATEACFIRFGNTGVGAAAADANSMYFPAGVEYVGIPVDASGAPYDYVRVIRAGSNETTAQFERVA